MKKFNSALGWYVGGTLLMVMALIFVPIDMLIGQVEMPETGEPVDENFFLGLVRKFILVYFISETAFSAALVAITNWAFKTATWLQNIKKHMKVAVPVVISVLLTAVGYVTGLLLGEGIFAEMTLVGSLVFAINTGMKSNSIYDFIDGVRSTDE